MMSTRVDFRSFIENNFFEAGGNVSKQLALSGMTECRFRKKMIEEFGANPKEWLTEKMKTHIKSLAKMKHTTPAEIARKHFGCTATQLIAMVQANDGADDLS